MRRNAKKNAVSGTALYPVGEGIVGGTAGIEPASSEAALVLDISH